MRTGENTNKFTPINPKINSLLQIIKVGIFITLFLPLFVNNNLLFPFVFPRTIAFRLIIEICLALFIVIALLDKNYRPRFSILLSLITGFVGIMIVSSAFGANLYHSFWSTIERSEGINTWLHLLAFFVILTSVFKSKKDWLELFNLVIISGWLQVLYGFMQYSKSSYIIQGLGERIMGSLGNPTFFATYVLFIIFIAAYLITQKGSKLIKLTHVILILLNLFLLWHTLNRGSILALICGVLFFLILKMRQVKNRKTKIALGIILVILIISPLITMINKDSDWVQSSDTLRRITKISPTDITTQNRLIAWGVGWQGFKERPILGWGWENYNVTFNKYFNPALTRDIGSRAWYDRAHNVVVETAVATGLLGLIVYLSIIGWATFLLFKKQVDQKNLSTGNLVFITLILVWFLQNLFVFDTLSSYLLIFLVFGFIQVQQNLNVKEEIKEKEKEKITKVNTTKKIIIIAIIIITLPTAYFLNVKPVLANYYIIQAVIKNKENPTGMLENFEKSFKYSPPNDPDLRFILVQHARDQMSYRGINEETIPLIQYATKEMEKSIQATPEAVQNYIILAELYLITNQQGIELAENITLKALEIAPRRYQVYTMLGRIKMSQNQPEEGINYFKQAIELNDQFAETHWNLAMAYILGWQPELAQQSLDKAYELGYDIYAEENVKLVLSAFKDSKNLDATIDFLDSLVERYPLNTNYRDSLELLESILQQGKEATIKN